MSQTSPRSLLETRLTMLAETIGSITTLVEETDPRQIDLAALGGVQLACLEFTRSALRVMESVVDGAVGDDLMAVARAVSVERFGGSMPRRGH